MDEIIVSISNGNLQKKTNKTVLVSMKSIKIKNIRLIIKNKKQRLNAISRNKPHFYIAIHTILSVF